MRAAAATVVLVVVVMAGPARAETYYIAPDGSDRNEGTKSSPFGSFNHAIHQAQPGDTISVRGGIYHLPRPVRIERAGSSCPFCAQRVAGAGCTGPGTWYRSVVG